MNTSYHEYIDAKRYAVIDKNNSMGLVRYYLAFTVLVTHFNIIFGTDYYFPTSGSTAVGGFFALSGFLVYGSYLRHRNLRYYVERRARRILPPYLFIVLLAAIGLSLLSELPLQQYFTSKDLYSYLAANVTFLNFLHPDLPGVFTHNTMSAVNGSLWTIKVEILLYLSIPLVIAAIVWLHKRSRIFSTTVVFAVIYLASTIYRIYMQEMYDETGCEIYDILSRQVFGQLMYFYSGVFIYTKYDLLKCYSNHLIVAATILFVCSDNIPGYHYWLSPIVVSTLVIFISLLKGAKYFNHNNVSYDIYLLHFPVMQTIYVLFHDKFAPHILFAITLLSILALSEFSWHVIGKRFLK